MKTERTTDRTTGRAEADGAVATRMRAALTEALAPERLAIRDDSERHRGHGGWREGGETHFDVVIVSAAFQGVGRVERQRMVHRALKAELADRVHALSMTLSAPGEA